MYILHQQAAHQWQVLPMSPQNVTLEQLMCRGYGVLLLLPLHGITSCTVFRPLLCMLRACGLPAMMGAAVSACTAQLHGAARCIYAWCCSSHI
jgi:hypothetical protein